MMVYHNIHGLPSGDASVSN